MIYGIGTDIIKIERIAAALERNGDRFAARILGAEEMAKFKDRSARVPARGVSFLATRFAAKEAFSKAIGLGMRMPMTWRSMQVLNAPSGKPVAVLSGALLAWFTEQGLTAHVTITDEVEYGVAFVVVEK
jgi:holo-[acyl-carrier protein] synthase